jgi:large subunit ribosomal protein L23
MKDATEIIRHPYVTEKTMTRMEEDNQLEFVVDIDATKTDIKWAVEDLLEEEVKSVNTHIPMDGKKHALVAFPPDVDAEDVGMRIGIF